MPKVEIFNRIKNTTSMAIYSLMALFLFSILKIINFNTKFFI